VAETQAELARLYEAGHIRPVVGKTYPLEQAPAAMRDLANRKILGKAVLTARAALS
jgi:NADPH2:quinone reductase